MHIAQIQAVISVISHVLFVSISLSDIHARHMLGIRVLWAGWIGRRVYVHR